PIYGAQLSINDTVYYYTLALPIPRCNGKFEIDSIKKNNENAILVLCNYLITLSPIKLYIYDRIINYDAIEHVIDYPIYGDELSQEPEPIDSIVFTAVNEMPKFIGGNEALIRFINNNFKYPDSLRGSGIEGRVYVDIIVCRDGSVSKARVYQGIHPDIDREVLRVVNLLPQFIPGKQDGDSVNVKLQIPFTVSEK
ncbi:MAG: energy transducer TonB, partial [Muribaculaceae bacterium]|nr:energy transducer TonB [Muribaculaceae bacterium]